MRAKVSKAIVIDASVARASGGPDACDPRSSACHRFLKTTIEVCHRMVLTREIKEEWNRHESEFFTGWRKMMAQKGKFVRAEVYEGPQLVETIEREARSDKERAEMMKDCHLLQAALATDRIIVSLDDKAQKLFADALADDADFRKIEWYRPEDFPAEP